MGLLAGISAERYWAVRNDVYRCILATDITRHGEYIASAATLAQHPAAEVDPSFRALSGRLKFTVRRHTFNKESLSGGQQTESSVLTTYWSESRRF